MDRLEMDLLLKQWAVWDAQLEQLQGEIGKRQAEHKTAGSQLTSKTLSGKWHTDVSLAVSVM